MASGIKADIRFVKTSDPVDVRLRSIEKQLASHSELLFEIRQSVKDILASQLKLAHCSYCAYCAKTRDQQEDSNWLARHGSTVEAEIKEEPRNF